MIITLLEGKIGKPICFGEKVGYLSSCVHVTLVLLYVLLWWLCVCFLFVALVPFCWFVFCVSYFVLCRALLVVYFCMLVCVCVWRWSIPVLHLCLLVIFYLVVCVF